jgi:hypothetical protein
MEKKSIRPITGWLIHSHLWAVVLCGAAGLVLAASAMAKDQDTARDSGATAEFHVTISGVREVPVGNPMPGLHLQAKVKGRMMDIYVAPVDFVAKCGVKVSKGDEVHIVGSQTRYGEADVVLAREITIGSYTNGTYYLRNDDGPFWEETKPVPQPLPAH